MFTFSILFHFLKESKERGGFQRGKAVIEMKTFFCLFHFCFFLFLSQTHTHTHTQFPSPHSFGYMTVSEVSGCQYLLSIITKFSSVQFSHSVVSDSLLPHELQHARPPCPSPTPRVYPNSCPLSRWCHPTISSSVIPFSSCPQSFPTSGYFQMSQLFAKWVNSSLTMRKPHSDLIAT